MAKKKMYYVTWTETSTRACMVEAESEDDVIRLWEDGELDDASYEADSGTLGDSLCVDEMHKDY
jgi:hypothetical protein